MSAKPKVELWLSLRSVTRVNINFMIRADCYKLESNHWRSTVTGVNKMEIVANSFLQKLHRLLQPWLHGIKFSVVLLMCVIRARATGPGILPPPYIGCWRGLTPTATLAPRIQKGTFRVLYSHRLKFLNIQHFWRQMKIFIGSAGGIDIGFGTGWWHQHWHWHWCRYRYWYSQWHRYLH